MLALLSNLTYIWNASSQSVSITLINLSFLYNYSMLSISIFHFISSMLILNHNLFWRSSLCQWTIRPTIWRIMRSRAYSSSRIWSLHSYISSMNWMLLNVLNVLILWHIMVVLLIIHKSCWGISLVNFINNFFVISLILVEKGRVLMLILLRLNLCFMLLKWF